MSDRRELFIYYRVAPGHEMQAVAAALRMQAMLCGRHPGLSARLLRRADTPPITLMEIYGGGALAAGIDQTLQSAIEQAAAAALAVMIDGQRHVEAFAPCA